jgi:hypothetical protein
VHAGGFIFRQPVVQNTGQMPGNPLCVLVVPGNSKASLYEDDGESLKYRHGDFMRREFTQTCFTGRRIFEVSAPEGSWRPAKRDLILETWIDRAPRTVVEQGGDVTVAGSVLTGELPQLNADERANARFGWWFSNGLLTIKVEDPFEALRFGVNY